MSVLLFANVGNSDLRIDGQRPKLPRPEAEQAWREYDAHQFELPIIQACVEYVLAEREIIDQVVLFYTDQPATPETTRPDRNGIALRDKDTIWFAAIIQRMLAEHFGAKIAACATVRIERASGAQINPSMPDEAFDAFGELLPRWHHPEVTHCYVLMSGGLPACNSAIQVQSVATYGPKCSMLYKPEGKEEAIEQRVGDQLQNEFRRSAALEALERMNFVAALALVDGKAPKVACELLRFAVYREAFDFERAGAALRTAGKLASGDLRTLISEMQRQFATLAQHTMPSLLRELELNAQIAFRNERYADFLGRVFRFQEAALRYIVEEWGHIPTDVGQDRDRFERAVQAHPKLEAFLQGRTYQNQPLRYDQPSIPALTAVLIYLTESGTRADGTPAFESHERGPFVGIKKLLGTIEKLTQLRNQSVIAHGFTGISREALAAACDGDPEAALTTIQQILAKLAIAHDTAFDQLITATRSQIQHGAFT